MFWSAEFVLLYWLSTYSGIRLFKISSILVCALTLGSLLIDWNKENSHTTSLLAIIFSSIQGIVTNIVAVAAFGVYYILLKKNDTNEFLQGVANSQVRKLMLFISLALLYITCIFGVNLYYSHQATYDVPNVYHRLITELFGLALLVLMQRNKLKASPALQLFPLILCFIYYLASYDPITNLRTGVLSGHYTWLNIYWHWADSILLGILFYSSITSIRNNPDAFSKAQRGISILMAIMSIAFLSIDLMHIYVVIGYRKNNTDDLVWQYGKAGLTALWGICSFALMWIGMKYKQKTLRIISLTLFTIVLLKLFIIDISGISEGGKIFAFILLGVLLLVVSFMYQKLKKIIIDDHKK